MGSSQPRSTLPTEGEEATIVKVRCRTLLPLDDVLGCLRKTTCAGDSAGHDGVAIIARGPVP